MFIIDFDSTLYHSHALSDKIKEKLFGYGVTEEHFAVSVHEAVHGKDGNYFDYSLSSHIDLLAKMGYEFSRDEVLGDLEKIFENKFIFDDTHHFLDSLKMMGQKIILLTAGNEKFQKQKIANAEIETYFDEIAIVHNEKEKYIEQNIDKNQTVFFINDNLKENIKVKNHHPELVVLTKWNMRKDAKEDIENSGIPYFETLTEILNFINQYGQE